MSIKPNQSLYPFGLTQEQPRIIFDAETDAIGGDKFQVEAGIDGLDFWRQAGPQLRHGLSLITHSDVLQYNVDKIEQKTTRPRDQEGTFDYTEPDESEEYQAVNAALETWITDTDKLLDDAEREIKARRLAKVLGAVSATAFGTTVTLAAKGSEAMTDDESGIAFISFFTFLGTGVAAAASLGYFTHLRRNRLEKVPATERIGKFIGAVMRGGLKLTRTKTEE